MMREQDDYTLKNTKWSLLALSNELELSLTELDTFLVCLLELELLVQDEHGMTSLSLVERMEQYDHIRQIRSEAGRLGGRPKKQNKAKLSNSLNLLKQKEAKVSFALQEQDSPDLEDEKQKEAKKSNCLILLKQKKANESYIVNISNQVESNQTHSTNENEEVGESRNGVAHHEDEYEEKHEEKYDEEYVQEDAPEEIEESNEARTSRHQAEHIQKRLDAVASFLTTELQRPDMIHAIKQWIAYKLERGEPIRTIAAESLAQVVANTPQPEQCIAYSIAQNYASICVPRHVANQEREKDAKAEMVQKPAELEFRGTRDSNAVYFSQLNTGEPFVFNGNKYRKIGKFQLEEADGRTIRQIREDFATSQLTTEELETLT